MLTDVSSSVRIDRSSAAAGAIDFQAFVDSLVASCLQMMVLSDPTAFERSRRTRALHHSTYHLRWAALISEPLRWLMSLRPSGFLISTFAIVSAVVTRGCSSITQDKVGSFGLNFACAVCGH